ncbi:MAG: putative bifunctional diguanylate cyclase/phosphodiesterase, partial [Acidimicrobiales bacterium]
MSAGIALSEAGRDQVDELMRDADLAMYRAKEAGKGRYEFFEGTMSTEAHRRVSLETELRRAAERGELRVEFQPEVELETGQMLGLEALVRWQHPAHGLLPPAAFIPLAEETGLIVPIGKWVLEQACAVGRGLAAQRAGKPPLRISVNVSARQLQRGPLYVEEVSEVISRSGIDPATLVLEITESAIMGDPEMSVAVLTQLRGLGVDLVIDDFGTGYSSLAYLKHFPVSGLKLDKSFVDTLDHRVDSAIARSVVALGAATGLRIVAEGIEESRQVEELLSIGCTLGQGYWFARPVAAEDVLALSDPDGSLVRRAVLS